MRRNIQVIKRYQAFTETISSPDDIPYHEDAAVTYMRSMHGLATLHCERVSSPEVVDVMMSMVEDIRNVLAKKNRFR